MKLHKIFPVSRSIDSMKRSQYNDPAHAIAELIDNSIQAGQDSYKPVDVKLICVEEAIFGGNKRVNQIKKIAIYDDASGMSPETLRLSLAVGEGTRLGAKKGMGKFGVGLPSASIYLCNKVDVWSWQNGKIFHTYLDLREIEEEDYDTVPEPKSCDSLPEEWSSKIKTKVRESGTLIVWTDLERLKWKKYITIFKHTAFITGRMYRYFLQDSKAKITMLAYEGNDLLKEQKVLPNDPLYLMKNSQAPEPYNEEPAFDLFGDEEQLIFKLNGEEHVVKLKFSIAKQDFRRSITVQGKNPGDAPLGKQCAKNQGVSIVRARREIEMNHTFETFEPVERWWGVEVAFEPGADEIFGVTNNKQSAEYFKKVKANELEEQEGMPEEEFRIIWKEQGDPQLPILDLSTMISSKLAAIRKQVDNQTRGVKVKTKMENGIDLVSVAAEEVARNDGQQGISDEKSNRLTGKQKKKEMEDEAETSGISKEFEDFDKIVNAWLHTTKFIFDSSELPSSPVIFGVSYPAGKIKVTFNKNHRAYEKFIQAIEEEDGLAFASLKLLFAAWARMEDTQGQRSGEDKRKIERIRVLWGDKANEMLDEFFKFK